MKSDRPSSARCANEVMMPLLNATLQDLQSKNSSYSLRSFASKIAMSPGHLSRVLNGQKVISYIRSEKIIELLDLPAEKKGYYLAKLRSRCGLPSLALRNFAEPAQFEEMTDAKRYKRVDRDSFIAIGDWYHAGIFTLYSTIEVKDFQAIADRLGITLTEASEAIARMCRIGLYKKEKSKYLRVGDGFYVPRAPSRALRQCHKQLLYKSFQALEKLPFDQRDISGLMLSTDSEQFPMVLEEIARFREYMYSKFSSGSDKSKLHFLAIQFFPLESPQK